MRKIVRIQTFDMKRLPRLSETLRQLRLHTSHEEPNLASQWDCRGLKRPLPPRSSSWLLGKGGGNADNWLGPMAMSGQRREPSSEHQGCAEQSSSCRGQRGCLQACVLCGLSTEVSAEDPAWREGLLSLRLASRFSSLRKIPG